MFVSLQLGLTASIRTPYRSSQQGRVGKEGGKPVPCRLAYRSDFVPEALESSPVIGKTPSSNPRSIESLRPRKDFAQCSMDCGRILKDNECPISERPVIRMRFTKMHDAAQHSALSKHDARASLMGKYQHDVM